MAVSGSSHRRNAVCPQGILKPRRKQPECKWEKLSLWQRLMHVTRQGLTKIPGFVSARRQFKRFVEDRHIKFNGQIAVTEFSRRLDGGSTVPGDGTIVTLGLGRPVRQSICPLAPQPPFNRLPIEERAWLTPTQRVRILKAAMGENRFFGAWVQHKSETRKIRRNREESNRTQSDVSYMPTSMAIALERAAKAAAEAAHHIVNPAPKSVCAVSPPLKRALKKRKHYDSENVDPKFNSAALRSSVPQCHRCLQPINTCEGVQCLCLIASPQSPAKMRRK